MESIEALTPTDPMDPHRLIESIEYALESVVALEAVQQLMQRARTETHPAAQQRILRLAAGVRQSAAAQFSVEGELASQPALESAAAGYYIMALEEEGAKNKNFIARIIDAIVKAFDWLWTKITSFFTGGETKEGAEAENKALESKIKALVEADAKFPEKALTNKSLTKAFSTFPGAADSNEITKVAEQQTEKLGKLNDAFLMIVSEAADFRTVVSAINDKTTAEDVLTKAQAYHAKIVNGLKTGMGTTYTPAMEKLGFKPPESGLVMEESFVLEGLFSGSGMGAFGVFYSKGGNSALGKYTSNFAKVEPKETASIVLTDGIRGMEAALMAILKLRLDVADKKEAFAKKSSEIKAANTTIQEALKTLKGNASGEMTPEATKAVNALLTYIGGVGNLETGLLAAFGSVTEGSRLFNTYLEAVVALAEKKPKKSDEKPAEETAAETKPDATPEAKPASS